MKTELCLIIFSFIHSSFKESGVRGENKFLKNHWKKMCGENAYKLIVELMKCVWIKIKLKFSIMIIL